MDKTEWLQQQLAGIPTVELFVGTYVGRSGSEYVADVAGNRIPVAMNCPEPMVNDRVNVWNMLGTWILMGPAVPAPSEGTVQTVGASTVVVDTGTQTVTVPFLSSYTPSSGHVVQLAYNAQGLYVVGRLMVESVAPVAPPAPVVQTSTQPKVILATGSGSAREGSSSWWTNEVWASASNRGIYTYRSTVQDTFAAFGLPKSLHVFLPVKVNKYGNMRLGWHSYSEVSGTTPAILHQRVVAAPADGWVDITDLASSLATGGGIGFDGAGETVYRGIPVGGKAGDPQAGALRAIY